MGTDASGMLTAQGLEAADLEANRAGRVSQTQIARQVAIRRSGARVVWTLAVLAVVAGGGVGAVTFMQGGDRGIAIFMVSFGLVMAALPLAIYFAFRFVDPAKLAACTVTRIERAEVGGFLPSPNRGIYAIGLNGQRYSGFASALTRAHLGGRVNAYVVPEHRIVVALEPSD